MLIVLNLFIKYKSLDNEIFYYLCIYFEDGNESTQYKYNDYNLSTCPIREDIHTHAQKRPNKINIFYERPKNNLEGYVEQT